MIEKKVILRRSIKALLIVTLILNFVVNLYFSLLNSEVYLFGLKLSGESAIIYSKFDGTIGIIIASVLVMQEQNGSFLSLFYFLYNFIEILYSNIVMFYIARFSLFFFIGLILSILLIPLIRMK